MRPYLRYLRITWTVFCGIACLLLIVLWVRSYSRLEQLHFLRPRETVAISAIGWIDMSIFSQGYNTGFPPNWTWTSVTVHDSHSASWR